MPDPDDEHGAPSAPRSGDDSTSPYRNLLVPLVVVPAVIVMALVLVFVLFGAIAGEETTPRENVAKVMSGGANESRQAAFNLMRQVLEDLEAERDGRKGEWGIGPDLVPSLQAALEDRLPVEDAGDVAIPLALSATLANLGDEAAIGQLADFLRLDDRLDPGGQFRYQAAMILGSLGGSLAPVERRLAVERLVELFDSEDLGLRAIAAIALQNFPIPAAVTALERALGDRSLEVRGSAALALAEQGDPAGAEVLLSMLTMDVYEEERRDMPGKWVRGEHVSASRTRALTALAAIDRLPADSELERLAEDDPDASIRSLARTLLARSE